MNVYVRRNIQLLACATLLALSVGSAKAESCVTQSQMPPEDRDALATTARTLADKVQHNDQPGVQGMTIAEFASNFAGIGGAITEISPKLAGDAEQVEQVYVLDAHDSKPNADGSAPDAEFICALNKGDAEADFSIRSLPPGKYAFAMVKFSGASQWMLSMLLRQDAGTWKLAGLFPKEQVAGGHDGLWYWAQGRDMAKNKQPWVAYVYYQEAQDLLRPAAFVSSTHLENLRVESTTAIPPEVANGLSSDAPLILKGADGTQYRVTSIVPDDTLRNKDGLDVAVHMVADTSITDPIALQQRNRAAMSAFLARYPEFRTRFHGVYVYSETPDHPPISLEAAMNDIH